MLSEVMPFSRSRLSDVLQLMRRYALFLFDSSLNCLTILPQDDAAKRILLAQAQANQSYPEDRKAWYGISP